jgi:hypothetical protein
VTLTDAVGVATAAELNVTVVPDPQLRFLGVPAVDAGVRVNPPFELTNGTPPFTYAWSTPAGPASTDPSAPGLIFGTPGPQPYSLVVRDAFGERANATAVALVNASLRVNIVGPEQVPAGRAAAWSLNVTGGSLPLRIVSGGTPCGGLALTTLNVTVLASSTSGTFGLSSVEWGATGIVIVVALIAIVVLVRRRGRAN